jgi:hypothetical protein
VTDEHNRFQVEAVEKADDVADQVEHAVGGHVVGDARPTAAPHVGCENPVPRLGQRRELVPPRIPQLGHAVQEDHGRASVTLPR